MLENIPLIRADNTWGSGVIMDPVRKLILTCSHVIKHGRSNAGNDLFFIYNLFCTTVIDSYKFFIFNNAVKIF